MKKKPNKESDDLAQKLQKLSINNVVANYLSTRIQIQVPHQNPDIIRETLLEQKRPKEFLLDYP
jgi:hypothetical protein